ncbi:MAG TPA: cytochrome c oxidase subunit 2A [Bacilli bacterium]
MADHAKLPEKDETANHKNATAKMTYFAVLLLGGFLAAAWLVVFILFLARNG